MSDLAIRTEGLGKRYRIGGQRLGYSTLGDALMTRLVRPFRRNGRHDPAADVPTIWALKDVSLEVKRGEAVGIIGRNGAGKSTFLKVLSRIIEPTEGWAEVHGRVGSLLEVGTGFHLELTGRENIYLNGAILGMRKAEIDRKFNEITSFAQIEKFLDTPVKRYSSGMFVRLAFAVAAHLEPEILLVDEVLAVGDAAFQEMCLGKMHDVTHAGRTVLFVSHNMSAIIALCQRAVWLDEGGLKLDGPPAEVVQRYLEATLARTRTQSGFISLAERLDRKGDGLLRLTHIRLLDGNGGQVQLFRSGQAVKIAIGYLAREDRHLNNVGIGFTVVNNRQQFVTWCQNKFSGDALGTLPASGEFVCEFPKLALMPGRYGLNVAVTIGPSSADGVFHAGEFEVIEGNFYPTRLLPPPGFGDALLEYRWSLGGNPDASEPVVSKAVPAQGGE